MALGFMVEVKARLGKLRPCLKTLIKESSP